MLSVKHIVAMLVCVISMQSCTNNIVASDMQEMPEVWELGYPVEFKVPAIQSNVPYNVYLEIRNTNQYPFSNIFLLTTLKYPNGKTAVDTLEYRMAAPDGQWLGQGLGSVKQNKLVYKEDFQFIEDGNYTLSITHAVRNNGDVQGVKNLKGITDVGYSIEKSNTD